MTVLMMVFAIAVPVGAAGTESESYLGENYQVVENAPEYGYTTDEEEAYDSKYDYYEKEEYERAHGLMPTNEIVAFSNYDHAWLVSQIATGTVTLTGQTIDLTGVITITSNVTINGIGTITVSGNHRHFLVGNTTGTLPGHLTLDGDVTLTRAAGYNDNGGGIQISPASEFVMNGGTISNNQQANGGAVLVQGGTATVPTSGNFTMNNGEISHNIATTSGGAVFVNAGAGEDATFTMNDGLIYDNTAVNGGGVAVGVGATFTMYGGEVYDNTGTNGGGVHVNIDATFIMRDGEITYNTASNTGGGVMVNGTAASAGEFIMHNGSINNNIAVNGGGVSLLGNAATAGATFIMHDGEINHNTATTHGGGVRVITNAVFTMNDGEISHNRAGTLAAGHGGGIEAVSGSLIITGGTIYNNETISAQGGGIRTNLSTVSIANALIDNNRAAAGGGLAVQAAPELTISDSIITNNRALSHAGGMSIIDMTNPNPGTPLVFTITDTNISYNSAGIDFAGTPQAAGNGGTINITNAYVILDGLTAIGNRAGAGGQPGVVTAAHFGRTGELRVLNSYFRDNINFNIYGDEQTILPSDILAWYYAVLILGENNSFGSIIRDFTGDEEVTITLPNGTQVVAPGGGGTHPVLANTQVRTDGEGNLVLIVDPNRFHPDNEGMNTDYTTITMPPGQGQDITLVRDPNTGSVSVEVDGNPIVEAPGGSNIIVGDDSVTVEIPGDDYGDPPAIIEVPTPATISRDPDTGEIIVTIPGYPDDTVITTLPGDDLVIVRDPNGTITILPSSITVTAAGSATTVQAGSNLQFNMAAIAPTGAYQSVSWSVAGSAGNAVAGVSINQNGLLTVASNVAANTQLVITATSTRNAVFGTAMVTVQQQQNNQPGDDGGSDDNYTPSGNQGSGGTPTTQQPTTTQPATTQPATTTPPTATTPPTTQLPYTPTLPDAPVRPATLTPPVTTTPPVAPTSPVTTTPQTGQGQPAVASRLNPQTGDSFNRGRIVIPAVGVFFSFAALVAIIKKSKAK